jgi:hypothetical protein
LQLLNPEFWILNSVRLQYFAIAPGVPKQLKKRLISAAALATISGISVKQSYHFGVLLAGKQDMDRIAP